MTLLGGARLVTARLGGEHRWAVRCGRVLAATAANLGASAIYPVRMKDGTTILLDGRSRTEGRAFWTGVYDADLLATATRLHDSFPGAFYDVGANVGLVGLPVAAARRDQPVVAFEPVPANANRLRESVALNNLQNVEVVEVALGDQEGEVVLARESVLGATTGNAHLVVADDVPPGERSAARMVRLDDIVASLRLPPPSVVKLDVEGAEVGVITGGLETLRRHRPVIIGEFNNLLMPRFRHTFLDAYKLVAPLGYEVFAFVAGGVVRIEHPEADRGDVLLAPSEGVERLPFAIA